MTRTSYDIEQEFLATLKWRSEYNLDDWMRVLRGTGLTSRKALGAFLMRTYLWDHLSAQLLAGIFLNDGQPVYSHQTVVPPEYPQRS